MSLASPMPPVVPPATPVMLYIGAGYDLSPLLTFAPGGPPYPIVPLAAAPAPSPQQQQYTYTSFLFVDAKPRYTSAYMVADFDEWRSVDARVRNIMHYAQGTLDRWRPVDTTGDLLWFEGGGTPADIARRRSEGWRFPAAHPPRPPGPLTTLLYLFNTLDVELAATPALARVLPRVEALYVHGLRVHARTGLVGRVGALARCFVIVGSWGTVRRGGKRGVRDVDFVRAAREARRTARGDRPAQGDGTSLVSRGEETSLVSWGEETLSSRDEETSPSRDEETSLASRAGSPLEFWCGEGFAEDVGGQAVVEDASMEVATQAFDSEFGAAVGRAQRVRALVDAFVRGAPVVRDGQASLQPVGTSPSCLQVPSSQRRDEASSLSLLPSPPTHMRGRPDLRLDLDVGEPCTPTPASAAEPAPPSPVRPARPVPSPFHIRIPQLAWSDTLRDGRGGYYVAKTVQESLAVWRARAGDHASKEGDRAGARGCACAERRGRQARLRPRTPNLASKTEVRDGEADPKKTQRLRVWLAKCVGKGIVALRRGTAGPRECGIDIAAFLSTTSVGAHGDEAGADAADQMFPRSPYGPLHLDDERCGNCRRAPAWSPARLAAALRRRAAPPPRRTPAPGISSPPVSPVPLRRPPATKSSSTSMGRRQRDAGVVWAWPPWLRAERVDMDSAESERTRVGG